MTNFSSNDKISAFEAVSAAQHLAFSPIMFQCALCLRDFGILYFLDKAGSSGAAPEEIARELSLSEYAVGVLADMGIAGRLIYERENRLYLGKIGYFLIHDEMTRVNFDFTAYVCYEAMARLKESLKEGKPEGLKVFGPWESIYPALSSLPQKARQSWFAFDHFYSDAAFREVLPIVFKDKPKLLYDVGGNTGRFACRCLSYDPDIKVAILDLPQQIELAQQQESCRAFASRLSFKPLDVLKEQSFPEDADIWWLSQFLDCFSEDQIIAILGKIKTALKPEARIYILELFSDNQRFEAANFSINASSLYFSCLANGNSRFYRKARFCNLISRAGLDIRSCTENIGLGHTLLELA